MGKVKSSPKPADIRISEVEHITDLVKMVGVNRRSVYDWDRLCNGTTHKVWMPKCGKSNLRSAFTRACKSRGLESHARWQDDTEEEVDGEVWGDYLLQAVPLPNTAA